MVEANLTDPLPIRQPGDRASLRMGDLSPETQRAALPDLAEVWRDLWADPDFHAWLAWCETFDPGATAAAYDEFISETML